MQAATPPISPDKTPPSKERVNVYRLALMAIGALLYLPGLGSYGPLDPTDSFFIEASREIVESGNYLLPMINYEPWLDKPILYFWAVAACQNLLGDTAFAGRIFTALTAIAMGFVIFASARRFIGAKQAFVAAVVFYSFPLSSALGHESLTDMPLTLFMSSGLLALFYYHKKGNLLVLTLGYLALALAFLCKGPIAVILVAAILGLHIAITSGSLSGFWQSIWQLKPLWGLALIFAVNAPWYFAANAGTNGKFFMDFFITQNFGRMVGTVNHQQPFWFYIPVVLGGLFPWSLILFSSPSFNKRLFAQRTKLSDSASFVLLQIVWACFVLLLFSAIKTKLPTYILPAMAPLAILTGRAAFIAARSALKSRLGLKISAIVLFVAVLVFNVLTFKLTGWVGLFLKQQQLLLGFLLVGSLVYMGAIFAGKIRHALCILLAIGAISVAFAMPQAHLAFYQDRQMPVNALTMQVKEQGGNLATIIRFEPSFEYYLHHHVPCITSAAEAQAFLNHTKKPHWIMAPKEVLQNIDWFRQPGKEIAVVAKTNKWTLFKID